MAGGGACGWWRCHSHHSARATPPAARLSIKTFVGKVSSFTEVYRMAAYAAAALVFAWIPILGAFAFTYALMVLMGIGVQSVYRTSFLTAVVTALAGFVPVASVLVWLTVAGMAS